MAVYLPIRALNRSAKVRIDSQQIAATATSYIDVSSGSIRKQLAYHSSIGQIYVVGPLTASNLDEVVFSGGVVSNDGSDLTVDVTAGELVIRSTGVYIAGASADEFALTAAHATLARIDLITWDAVSGAVGKTDGTPAASPVAPSTPAGKVALATVLVPALATDVSTITDVRPRA